MHAGHRPYALIKTGTFSGCEEFQNFLSFEGAVIEFDGRVVPDKGSVGI